MAQAELIGSEWSGTVERLGGAEVLEQEARATGAFRRPREVKCGVDLLRLNLAYCLGVMGLRLTAAWAEGIGLASLSNVAPLGRLRIAVPWLQSILARLLAQAAPVAQGGVAGGRLIRLVDATTVRKAGKSARESGRLWRVHAIFDLPAERFSAFELADEKGAERINRMAVIPGELRVGDAVHCSSDRRSRARSVSRAQAGRSLGLRPKRGPASARAKPCRRRCRLCKGATVAHLCATALHPANLEDGRMSLVL
jgi:hypothetical protein